MAARIEPAPSPALELLDLRQISSRDLEPVLQEEIETWRRTLDWDFNKSAELVRRFVDLRALNGAALLVGGQAAGYVYYVFEDHKGLIGDLYVLRSLQTVEAENRLLEAALGGLIGAAGITRIESQLMMIAGIPGRPIPGARFMTSFERSFMCADFDTIPELAPGRARSRIQLETWSEAYQEPAAQLIAAAYEGHIDSHINDQYRSAAGARRFLYNIVQYPGCGSFFRPGSFAAFEALTGRLCGISLTSLVAPEVGHITQICVSPAMKGAGAGYELLRRSIDAFRQAGCRKATLTVTSANREAIQLYERCGFRTIRRFHAYAWENF